MTARYNKNIFILTPVISFLVFIVTLIDKNWVTYLTPKILVGKYMGMCIHDTSTATISPCSKMVKSELELKKKMAVVRFVGIQTILVACNHQT